jgi:23S rRNA (adenine2030-N6)-methyltransferase
LNYRHAFHAGNFADLVKHAILLAVLRRLTVPSRPLTILDTHAGAGVYDLGAEAARRSGEAAQGVARLMQDAAAPPVFAPLVEAVRACNQGGGLRLYPGSPWLAARALRAKDAYVGCELRPDDHADLRRAVPMRPGGPRVELLQGDGYALAAARMGAGALLLVDPPFERPDDYVRIVELVAGRPARQPALIWTPLKDLETFDAFLGAMEATGPSSLVAAQARLHPLHDPMRMNGCAVVLVDAPDVSEEARAACGWVAERLGGAGGEGRVERLRG